MSADETKTQDDPVESSRMSLGEHLDELRRRLLRATVGIVVAFVACWVIQKPIAEIVLDPLDRTVGWLNEDLAELHERRLAEDPELERENFFREVGGESVLVDPIPSGVRTDKASSSFFFYVVSVVANNCFNVS